MVDKLEMSLDDIIKQTRTTKGKTGGGRGGVRRGGGRGGVGGAAGSRRQGGTLKKTSISGGGGIRKAKYNAGINLKSKFTRGDVNSAWKHDMYDGLKRSPAALKTAASGFAKLLVSNLDYGVSCSDIRELFYEFGPLKKAAVHYDRSGRSLGTADVIFERRADALKAIRQYNGVPLDGRPMNILLATSDVSAFSKSPRLAGAAGNSSAKKRLGNSPNQRRGAGNRRGGAGGNRGGKPSGAGGRRNKAPTAEELDAELDAYVNDMKN